MQGWVLRAAAVLAFLVLAGPAPRAAAATAGVAADATPRIAVMSAFEPELERLLSLTEDRRTVTVNGIGFTTGRLAGRPVVLVLSGISMVNAAMTTQLLLDRFSVRSLVFSGVAGGIDPALNVGDVTVPARWGQFLESYVAREDAGRYAPPSWATTPFPNFGMFFPTPVTVRAGTPGKGEKRFWFEASATLLETASRVAPTVALDRCTADGQCLEHAPRVVVGGNGVSGPAFVDNAGLRDYLAATFQARATDMESAAVAMVAQQNGVPFIAFRSLSDLAGADPDENRMYRFLALAAGNSAKVVVAFLGALPAEP